MDNQQEANGDGPPKRTCILILGMHRSGTSAITRVLSYMGAALPQNILGANEGNKTGHWEPKRLIAIHDELLSELDSSWDDWLSINLNKLPQERRRYYKNQIQTIIQEEYGRASLFVLKDPRVCKILSFYSELLKEINVEIKIVAQFRNPLNVMDSLQTRDGMLSSDAALLWLQYVLCSEKSSRNFERVFVKYDDIVKNWRTCHQAITRQLNVKWLYQFDEIKDQIDQFISPKLSHHSHTDEEVLFDPLLRQWVGEAYDALLILQKNPSSKNAQKRLDDITEEFEKASPMLVKIKSALSHSYEERINESAQLIVQQENIIAEREQLIAQQENIIAEREQLIAQKDALIEEQVYQFHSDFKQLDRLYSNSTSWKLTAPLRGLKLVLKKPIRLVKAIPKAVKIGGGVLSTTKKVFRIFQQEGSKGLIQRFHLAERQLENNKNGLNRNKPYVAYSKMTQTVHLPKDIKHKSKGEPIVVISMVKNEIGIIKDFSKHILSLFDYWICVDHCSEDGTFEFLSELSSQTNKLNLIRYVSEGYYQSEIMTYIANNHELCRNAKWVFFLDADEFLPFKNKKQFEDELNKYTSNSVIRMFWKNLVPKDYEHDGALQREVYIPTTCGDHSKIAFQPKLLPVEQFAIAQGNHEILHGKSKSPLQSVTVFALYHLPVRTFAQQELKLQQGIAAYNAMPQNSDKILGLHWRKIDELIKAHGVTDEMANYIAFSYGAFDFSKKQSMSRYELLKNCSTLTKLDVSEVSLTQDTLTNRSSYKSDIASLSIDDTGQISLEGEGCHHFVNYEARGTKSDLTIPLNKTVCYEEKMLINFMKPSYQPINHLTPTSWGGHIPFMISLVSTLQPSCFVELGSYAGASFFAACQAIRNQGISCDAVAVDLWEGDHQTGFYPEKVHNNFKHLLNEHYKDFARFIRSDFDQAATQFADNSIDLLHIDGLHTYEAVKNDFLTWKPKLTSNATVIFHDTTVMRDDFGVYKFWEEIKEETVSFNFQHTHGLGILAFGSEEENPIVTILKQVHELGCEEIFELHFARMGQLACDEALHYINQT